MKHAAVILVGTGVVGRAILDSHVQAGISVTVADQDADSVREAVDQLFLSNARWERSDVSPLGDSLHGVTLNCRDESNGIDESSAAIVIESITERLDAKQQFFAAAEQRFPHTTLCSNTSTLRIEDIGRALEQPDRLCGMHFFMPVKSRKAVEVIASTHTADQSIQTCLRHVHRIGKDPLVVGDGPGFVVNRLLSPYLNEAMLLLGRGVGADQIESAARTYGMPMSPLELIDWIGTRTIFDAGRVYWQSYPARLNPSPMLAGLIKNGRLGRASGSGLYDYSDGLARSAGLSPITLEFCEMYRRDEQSFSDTEVMHLLAIPMWIEAAIAYQEGIVRSPDQFNLAMGGGLGFQAKTSWIDFFNSLGNATIRDAITKWSPLTASMKAPDQLVQLLEESNPNVAFERFAG